MTTSKNTLVIDAREFTVEVSGSGASALLGALGGSCIWPQEGDCSSSKEVGLTFEVPGEGRRPAPRLLA